MKIPPEIIFAWSKIENKKKVYWGIAATLTVSLIAAIVPYIYGRLVDLSLKSNASTKIILGIIFIWLILSIFRDAIDRLSTKFAYETANDMWTNFHVDIIQRLLILPISFHKEKKMGEVSDKISRGIEDFYGIIEDTIFSFAPTIITFFLALGILLFVEWRLTLILILASIAYIIITLSHTKNVLKKHKKMRKALNKAFADRHDILFNVMAVKSSTAEESEHKKNRNNFDKASIIYKDYRYLWLEMDRWQSAIFTISFILVFSLGIFMLKNGALTPGKLIMFVGYISLLTAPLSRIANQYRRIKRALASFKGFVKFFYINPEKNFPNSKDIADMKGEVVFVNVDFGYKKGNTVLKNINFKVNKGETVALVGESGVGKSTLVNLIGRYYLPSKGKILIDGIDIKKINIKSLRENMAIVPQEVLLFHDTIKNNISYGRPDAAIKEIIEAAKAANAHEFIESFPKKYEQLVGERGIKLSTGQKQRIAIARAILRNPKILILDEATSALDSASEKLVQEALSHLIKGRTTFVIAHRLSTIISADKIMVLEKGQIVEVGKHYDLMQNSKGIYRKFWELQTAIQKIN